MNFVKNDIFLKYVNFVEIEIFPFVNIRIKCGFLPQCVHLNNIVVDENPHPVNHFEMCNCSANDSLKIS